MKKTKSSTKITVKIKRNNGSWFIPKKTETRVLAHSASVVKLKEAYLKVEYLPGILNEGTFYNYDDFMQALKAWLEPELIDFVDGGEWE